MTPVFVDRDAYEREYPVTCIKHVPCQVLKTRVKSGEKDARWRIYRFSRAVVTQDVHRLACNFVA